MEDSYFKDSEKKTTFFYIALVLLLLCEMLSINTDLAEFSQHTKINIPQWFFIIIFSIDTLVILSIIMINFYKKWAVYSIPVLGILHFLLHHYYLSTMLYSDINFLFMFFCVGLLVVIPKWKFFN